MPRFSSSITRASGNRRCTISSVSSVDPWSTTIVSWPRTLSRQRSIHCAELKVTTTAETSDIGLVERGAPGAAEALPEEDPEPGQRERDRDEEEQEPGGERFVRADPEVAEEADEEGLANREAVDGERHEQDEEEERAHHVVRPRRELDANGLAGQPDREHADRLHRQRQDEDAGEQGDVAAVGVNPLVDRADGALHAKESQHRRRPGKPRPQSAREEQNGQNDGRDDERAFDPEVG